MDAAAPTLLIVANGPGEIGGWVLPIARELRRRSEPVPLRLLLALAPSQFASGTEQQMAAASGLFDQIISPVTCLTLALGLAHLPQGRPSAILHLGGDLWVSRLMTARWAVPAFAFVETPLVSRFGHYRAFREIFVANGRIAAMLTQRGVPGDQLTVTGDPRLDRVPIRAWPPEPPPDGRWRVMLLAGSRERFFRLMFPFWVDTAVELRRLHPDVEIAIAVTPDLPVEAVHQTLAPWPRTLDAHGITVRRQPAPEAITDADLVLTIPGTTTLEVAALPVAAIVALPLVLGGAVPAEGMLEWLLRFPLLRALRRLLALDWVTRHHTALPNRLAGRRIIPELVAATPPLVAASAFALLHDEPRRREMEAALAEVAGPRGASGQIAERMLAALAAQRKTAGSAVRVAG